MCLLCFEGIVYSDVISTLTFLSVVFGGGFALRKWNMTMKLRRAEYIKSLFDEIRTNPKIEFYKFEYDNEWYNRYFHQSGDLEKNIDYTLSFFSYICYLRKNGILNKADFAYFRYELDRITHNEQFKYYMYNLYHFSNEVKQPLTFVDLFQYAKNKKCFDKEFWNKQSMSYPHYLNF